MNIITTCGHHRHHQPGHEDHGKAAAPTAELRHEHEVVLRVLDVAERLARAPRLDRRALGDVVAFLETFVDRCHHGKEEQHLFPALADRGLPVEGGPIGTMLAEHEQGRALIRRMATGADTDAALATQTYAALMREHIAKENGVLFPMAEQVLSSADAKQLTEAFADVEQRLVGPGLHERLLADVERMEANAVQA